SEFVSSPICQSLSPTSQLSPYTTLFRSLRLGYVPAVRAKREVALQHKKSEYQHLVEQYYYNRQDNDDIYRQIHIDIPRMQPLIISEENTSELQSRFDLL